MPVRVKTGLNAHDRNTIRVPDAYRLAPVRKCGLDAMRVAPCFLTLADDDE